MFLFKRGVRSRLPILFFFILTGFLLPPSFLIGGQKSRAGDPSKDQERILSPGHLLLDWSWGWNTVADSRYREVYSGGNGIVTFAVHPIIKRTGRHSFGLSAGIKMFSKEGESTLSKQNTTLILTPVYLGGEYMLSLPPFYPGLEMGIDHCFYEEKSPLMTTKGSTTGYHVQGNVVFQLPGLAFLMVKMYIRHSRLPARESFRVNLGGLEYGAGLLIKLDFTRASKE